MQRRDLSIAIGLALLVGISHISTGQVMLTGMVADSASMQSLPHVNIVSKKTGKGTVTDLRGSFTLQASEGDSVIFSRVGYHTRTLPVTEIRNLVIIFLREEHKMLKTVEVEDRSELSWLPRLPPESAWKNSTWNKRSAETPGFQGIQTFGPGYVFKGVFSKSPKEEKEKRKLVRVREDNYRAQNYVSLVNDPEVKGKIMSENNLSEDAYYRLLAIFNEKNQDIIYRLEEHEIIALLLKFFASQLKKD